MTMKTPMMKTVSFAPEAEVKKIDHEAVWYSPDELTYIRQKAFKKSNIARNAATMKQSHADALKAVLDEQNMQKRNHVKDESKIATVYTTKTREYQILARLIGRTVEEFVTTKMKEDKDSEMRATSGEETLSSTIGATGKGGTGDGIGNGNNSLNGDHNKGSSSIASQTQQRMTADPFSLPRV